MNTILLWLNVTAAAVIFIHCVCRLTVKRWKLNQLEMWVHAILCGGSVGVVAHGLTQGAVHHPSEIIINFGLAAYFLSQSLRISRWKRNRMKEA